MTKVNGELTPELKAITQFVSLIFSKQDPSTSRHSNRVSAMAVQIAIKLHLSRYELSCLRMAGHLHDVGKLALIPYGILQKNEPLSPQEFEKIERHPVEGHKMLQNFTQNEIILSSVLEHHEKMDGSGYPHRVKTSSIFGQILAVADYYVARQEPRVYRTKALSRQESYKETLRECFHPSVLHAFELVCIAESRGKRKK